jgi:hypothetical protein
MWHAQIEQEYSPGDFAMSLSTNITHPLTYQTTLTMKMTRLIAGLAIAFISPITIGSFAPQANAQTSTFFQAVPGVRLCATIIDLSNANPDNLPLQMAARECTFIEYKRGLCLQTTVAQFPTSPDALDQCWSGYVTLTPNIIEIGNQLNQ